MKKICILILFAMLVVVPCYAEDAAMDSGTIDDAFRYTGDVENAFAGQKKVTDEDFEKALQSVKSKRKKFKQKPFKGQGLKEEDETSSVHDAANGSALLSLPVALLTPDGVEIPVGHYKVVGSKVKDKVYFDFYQAYTRVARVEGIETKNDFGEATVNFIKILPYDERRLKVIFGSLEFNAYAYVNIETTISDMN